MGTNALRRRFGGAVNRGFRPHHHKDASGSVARKVMQSLEKVKVLEKDVNGGRRISKDGQKDLDRIAQQILAAASSQE